MQCRTRLGRSLLEQVISNRQSNSLQPVRELETPRVGSHWLFGPFFPTSLTRPVCAWVAVRRPVAHARSSAGLSTLLSRRGKGPRQIVARSQAVECSRRKSRAYLHTLQRSRSQCRADCRGAREWLWWKTALVCVRACRVADTKRRSRRQTRSHFCPMCDRAVVQGQHRVTRPVACENKDHHRWRGWRHCRASRRRASKDRTTSTCGLRAEASLFVEASHACCSNARGTPLPRSWAN